MIFYKNKIPTTYPTVYRKIKLFYKEKCIGEYVTESKLHLPVYKHPKSVAYE